MENDHRKYFEDQWESIQQSLATFFYRKGCGYDDTCDLVQETAFKAWRGIDSLKGDFRSWVYKIARNVFVDYLRSRRRFESVVLDDNQVADKSTSSFERVDFRLVFDLILNEMDPTDRKCLILHDLEGKNYEEIAVEIGKSLSNAHYHTEKAREHLKKRFVELSLE